MIDLFVPAEIVCILSVAVVAGIYKTSNKSKLVLRNEIKAREKVEEEYRQALVFSETVLESSPAGILSYSTHTGQCVQANQAAAEILGGTVEKLLLQHLHAIPLMQEPDFNALVRQTTKDGTTRHFERNYTSSFGKTLFIHCTALLFLEAGAALISGPFCSVAPFLKSPLA